MKDVKRRDFLTLGTLAAAGLLTATDGHSAPPIPAGKTNLLTGGKDCSPATGKERKVIPSVCWQCLTRCPILGYIENERLVKIEGNPKSLNTRGKICARGQAGVNQVYNPDRLLHPLKRTGRRGEGKWQRISWKEALDLLIDGGTIAGHSVKGLRTLLDADTPEKFLFHYGRTVGSDWRIILDNFLKAYGTQSIGDHDSICMTAESVANDLTRGQTWGNWDFANAGLILSFGSNVLEAHSSHIPIAQRCMEALSRGMKMYTFDVRLSNTAAKSEWVPVRPGTDLAVILAMCHVLLEEELHDQEFLETYTNVTVNELRRHLAGYTPEWAAEKSGVPAGRIRSIAIEYGTTKPAVCISCRGAFMHYNGVQTQRAIMMLEAIAGNIDATGGSGGASIAWRFPFPAPKPKTEAKMLDIFTGEKGAFAFTNYNVSHQILHMIDKGPERPDLYMVYCHNPVYSNGDCRENARIYMDEEKVPFLVAVDVGLSETSELADLVLPDATYLERWTVDGRITPEHVPEYQIRQPMHAPLGEARNFCDVVCEIAERLDLGLGFRSAEEFVQAACEHTPGIKEAGGFEYMKENGVWCDTETKNVFYRFNEEVDVAGATLDQATGVYYKRNSDNEPYDSLSAEEAALVYVAQKCGDGVARRAFPPGSNARKTGLFEIKSEVLAAKGFSGIAEWMPDPTHEGMHDGALILTTYKVAVQSHSRTQNCKWLTELYHKNPAWIHPRTAARKGICEGDTIVITSAVGEVTTKAHVTEGVHPKAIAISNHCGHWASGDYASGNGRPNHVDEPDSRLKWWKDNGTHPNLIIPNRGDPISGAMCWHDTVVEVKKA